MTNAHTAAASLAARTLDQPATLSPAGPAALAHGEQGGASLLDPCAFCGVAEADPDSVAGLCRTCAAEMEQDRAEMDREDCRVGLCCSNACGGYCEGGSR